MTVRKGSARFVGLIFAALTLVLASQAPTAGASLDTVQRGETRLLADMDTLAAWGSDNIVAQPIAPATIVAEVGAAGFAFPVTGGTVESDTMLGTVNHAGGFSLQKYPAEGEPVILDVTDPQIFGGATLLANTFGVLPAPAADLTNATHSKNLCDGVISFEADATVGVVNAVVLNTYFDTDVFTTGMPLGHLRSEIETAMPAPGHTIGGKSLLLMDAPKKKIRMLTEAIPPHGAPGGSSDPVVNGGQVRLCSAGFQSNYELPAAGWSYIGKSTAPKGYRFKSKTGPIRQVDVRSGKQIKVVGQGDGLTHNLATNPNPLDIVVTTGDKNYCMRFGGTPAFIANKLYKAKKANGPDGCPTGS